MRQTPLILLSGMAADDRLFAPQREAFPDVVLPRWIDPLPRESLPDYAARFARSLAVPGPCVIGGASFGGIVALEMAAHVQARACVLISSVRSRTQLPWRYRVLRPAAALSPQALGVLAGRVAATCEPSIPVAANRHLRRLSDPRSAFIRWATWAVLTWRPTKVAREVPVLQIHGTADRTLPIRSMKPDMIVHGGGHLLTLTHPRRVNEMLNRALAIAS